MAIIIGIDPGSRITGFGVIQQDKQNPTYITSGIIKTQSKDFSTRLKEIFQAVKGVCTEYKPTVMAIERVFMHTNVDSALKLGHARGAAIIAGAEHDLPIHEYSAREVKQMVVGYGNAEKFQVQHMVRHLLKLSTTPSEDAADALAIALCHGQCHYSKQKLLQLRA